MVEQVFGALFVITLAGFGVALVIGIVTLVWPRGHAARPAAARHATAHA